MIALASHKRSKLTFFSTICSVKRQRKYCSSTLHYWLFVRGTHQWLASQRANNVENVSMSWHHKITTAEWSQYIYMVNFLQNAHNRHPIAGLRGPAMAPHSWPARASYGMSFVSFKSDLYSTNVIAVLHTVSGLILGLHPANDRRRYKVTPSLIGWAQTSNQPCNIEDG